MISVIKQVTFKRLRDTSLYFGATGVSFVLSLVTFPLFATYLNINEFAAFNYFNNYSGFFTFFFSFNLYMFFSAEFFTVSTEETEKLLKKLMSLLLVWNILAFLPACIISVLLLGYILKVQFSINDYLFLSLGAVSASTLKSLYLIKLRLKRQALQYFLLSIVTKVSATLLGLYLVIYWKPSGTSRFIGLISAEVFTSMIIYSIVFRTGGVQVPTAQLKTIIKFVWPLLLSSIVYYPLISVDQIILEKTGTKESLGLYGIGLNFASYVHLFNFSVYQTLEPDIIKAKAQGNIKDVKKFVMILIIVAVLTTVGYCFSSKVIIGLFTNNRYTEAYPYSIILSLSYLFVLLFSVSNTVLTVEKKGKSVLWSNTMGLILLIGLCFALRMFGSIGIAIARLLGFSFLAFIAWFFAWKKPTKTVNL